MATMSTFPEGHLVTAADWNEHVNQINTNTGDISANGASISSLGSRVGNLETKVLPKCILRKNVDQTIGHGPTVADVIVTWQVAEVDTGGMWSGDTIVIPEDGEYLLVGQANIQGGGTKAGDCVIYITLNGTDVVNGALAAFSQPSNNSTVGVGNGLSTVSNRSLVAGDVLRLMVWQDSGGGSRPARADKFGGCTFAVSKSA